MVDFDEELETVTKFGRAVVAKRIAIIAVVTIVLNLAVANGWLTGDLSNQAIGFITALFNALAGVTAVATIAPVVTPSKDPRDNSGVPLVPVDTVATSTDTDEDVDPGFDPSEVDENGELPEENDEELEEDVAPVNNSPEATDNDPEYVPEHATN